jgi:hypothetical protein
VGPCHNGMGRPWVTVGEDGLQMLRVAANALNKQSWRAVVVLQRGGGGGGVWRTPPHRKKNSFLRNVAQEIIKSRRIRWSGNAAHKEELRNAYSTFCWKTGRE